MSLHPRWAFPGKTLSTITKITVKSTLKGNLYTNRKPNPGTRSALTEADQPLHHSNRDQEDTQLTRTLNRMNQYTIHTQYTNNPHKNHSRTLGFTKLQWSQKREIQRVFSYRLREREEENRNPSRMKRSILSPYLLVYIPLICWLTLAISFSQ